ncbi:hypothetical protein HMPREF9442_03166 [Paraprevotella xylaniphila YIT 11841]|uniref:Uncharacterized protein n=1 Tax=Paraprevotella xylaniphila YIT 11841 TaxID=762982 RepID=F3QY74_9BACT|nr:hypothetical protein HMPREF9442_03166 [Paraprevotella xylaniphila YIT 11841]
MYGFLMGISVAFFNMRRTENQLAEIDFSFSSCWFFILRRLIQGYEEICIALYDRIL